MVADTFNSESRPCGRASWGSHNVSQKRVFVYFQHCAAAQEMFQSTAQVVGTHAALNGARPRAWPSAIRADNGASRGCPLVTLAGFYQRVGSRSGSAGTA